MGKDISEALQLAVQNVNNAHDLFNGTQLELEIVNCGCDPVQGAAAAVELIKKEEVAVLGPQSSVVAHFVGHLGMAAQVPILSYGATDPNLSEQQYPYFFRIAPSDVLQMEAVATLISKFDWKVVVMIYTDDDYGANGASALSRSLQQRGSRVADSSIISADFNASEIRSHLTSLDSVGSRVFVLHTPQGLGFRILSEAYSLRMISLGYVWIVTDLVASALVRPDLNLEFKQSLQGLLGMRRYIFPSPPFNDLVSQLQQNHPVDVPSLNTYGLYAYDAVHAVAHSISSHLAQGRNLTFIEFYKLHEGFVGGSDFQHMKVLQSGPALRESLLETAFLGTSGFIQFNHMGDISNATFEYINLVQGNAQRVAYWASQNNISNSPPQLLDNFTLNTNSTGINTTTLKIVWPGNSLDIPRGWAPPKNGQALNIGVPRKAGYTELVSQTTDSDNNTRYDGFCIMVFETAVKNLKYPLTYNYVPLTSKIVGKTNPVYDDLISKIISGELDGAVGDLTITADRLKFVDFTQQYIESGLVVLVAKKDKKTGNGWAFLRPYTGTMWGTIFGFTIFVGLVIWTLERHENLEFRGPAKTQLGKALWFIFSTLFTAHSKTLTLKEFCFLCLAIIVTWKCEWSLFNLENSGNGENTKTFLARIVLILWLFVVLILNSSYTASLTAILTVEQLRPTIQGLESLLRLNVPIGYQTGSFVKSYLMELKVPEERLQDLDSLDGYKTALDLGPDKGGVAAIVDELPYIEIFLATNCKHYAIAGQVFTKSGWGFAFPRGSAIAEDLSTEILKMSQTGQLSKLHDYWFKGQQCSDSGESVEEQSNQLGIKSLWVLFVIMGTTSIVCVLTYLLIQAKGWHNLQSYATGCCEGITMLVRSIRRRGE